MHFEPIFLIPLAALAIPIVAITAGTIEKLIKSQERRLEMRLKLQAGKSDSSQAEIDALKREIAALRDTSTQFDVSLSSSVERLEQRMGRVETKVAASSAVTPPEEAQILGRR